MITAFIPARGADDKLENKNTLPFGNSDLLTHKILQLKQCPKITGYGYRGSYLSLDVVVIFRYLLI